MRNRLLPYQLLVSTVALLCLVSEAQEDRWYQVELMVFSQRGAELAEQWDPEPQLSYPALARFLLDTEPEPTQTVQTIHKAIDPSPAPEPDDAMFEPLTAPAFVKLPADSREFEQQANRMARSGRYSVLFHESWIQPITDKASALPLIIDRLAEQGDWPLLQGSVTLHLSRYLHLETNLWLNTHGDYLSGDWRMPAPPLSPPTYTDETTDETTDELRASTGQPGEDSLGHETSQADAELENYPDVKLDPIYPYRHAVLLQQKRRMRSNEMHYIDHPMLGLVIKLTPLETDEG